VESKLGTVEALLLERVRATGVVLDAGLATSSEMAPES